MIFVSVGSQLPFDRLVRGVDEWARDNPEEPVFVQTGVGGAYRPQYVEHRETMPNAAYAETLRSCKLFVAHVGMGSILSGLAERKQMLMMPRRSRLGEHTTDHQLDTAAYFRGTLGLMIVDDVEALTAGISQLLKEPLVAGDGIPAHATIELIGNIATFLAPARVIA